MTEPQLYIVRYLIPCKDVIFATSPADAVKGISAARSLPYGSVIQGAYPATGAIPEAFGGPPEPPKAAA